MEEVYRIFAFVGTGTALRMPQLKTTTKILLFANE